MESGRNGEGQPQFEGEEDSLAKDCHEKGDENRFGLETNFLNPCMR